MPRANAWGRSRVQRRMRFVAVAGVLLMGCGGTQPSQWEPREPSTEHKTICTCDGVERPPKPSEASSDTDPRIVTAVCEGKVRECRPLLPGHNPILD